MEHNEYVAISTTWQNTPPAEHDGAIHVLGLNASDLNGAYISSECYWAQWHAGNFKIFCAPAKTSAPNAAKVLKFWHAPEGTGGPGPYYGVYMNGGGEIEDISG